MCLAKESAEIVQANGLESVAESVDGAALDDSLAALKLAHLQLEKHRRRARRLRLPSDVDLLTSTGRDLTCISVELRTTSRGN